MDGELCKKKHYFKGKGPRGGLTKLLIKVYEMSERKIIIEL